MILTYCGLLDDFSVRHNDAPIRTLDHLNAYLMEAALFGDRLLLSDGYLLSHPAVQQSVEDCEASPLRALVECGYVKILTRNDGHVELLADLMAENKIAQARALLATDWYTRKYKPLLADWSLRLRSEAFESFRNWPGLDRDAVFRSVAQAALAGLRAAEPDHTDQLDRFSDALAATPARRTEWESVSNALLGDGKVSPDMYRNLMRAAGESYHYSWGCSLFGPGDRIRVLTRKPIYLGLLDTSAGTLVARPQKPVRLFVPDLKFAGRAIKNRWPLLAEMLTSGHELNQLKQEFLAALQAYYSSQGGEEPLRRAAKAYTRALSKHFGRTEPVAITFDLAFIGAATAAGGMAAGPPGMIAGAAVGLAGLAFDHLGGPNLLWRLDAPNPKKWLRKAQSGDQTRQVSSFELSASEAAKHTAGARPYK